MFRAVYNMTRADMAALEVGEFNDHLAFAKDYLKRMSGG